MHTRTKHTHTGTSIERNIMIIIIMMMTIISFNIIIVIHTRTAHARASRRVHANRDPRVRVCLAQVHSLTHTHSHALTHAHAQRITYTWSGFLACTCMLHFRAQASGFTGHGLGLSAYHLDEVGLLGMHVNAAASRRHIFEPLVPDLRVLHLSHLAENRHECRARGCRVQGLGFRV